MLPYSGTPCIKFYFYFRIRSRQTSEDAGHSCLRNVINESPVLCSISRLPFLPLFHFSIRQKWIILGFSTNISRLVDFSTSDLMALSARKGVVTTSWTILCKTIHYKVSAAVARGRINYLQVNLLIVNCNCFLNAIYWLKTMPAIMYQLIPWLLQWEEWRFIDRLQFFETRLEFVLYFAAFEFGSRIVKN